MRRASCPSGARPPHDDGLVVNGRLSAVSRRAWTLYATLIVAIGVAGWFAYSSIYRTSSSAASGVARTVTVSRGNVSVERFGLGQRVVVDSLRRPRSERAAR